MPGVAVTTPSVSVQKDTYTPRYTHRCPVCIHTRAHARTPTSVSEHGPSSSTPTPMAPITHHRMFRPLVFRLHGVPQAALTLWPSGAPVSHFLTWDGQPLGGMGDPCRLGPLTLQGRASRFPGRKASAG